MRVAEPVGGPESYTAMPPTGYAGLSISSGSSGGYGEVRFDATSIKIE